MEVKSYDHQSIFQWSNSKNHSQLLACAQIHPDQSNLYNLDILSLDLSDRSKNLNVVGNAFYNVAFRCIAWDTFGERQNTYPNGVIFGGMQDGSYTLWNASQMINNYNKKNFQKSQQSIEQQPSFLYGQESQQGSYPIICAQWNSLKNNYLAFGSTDLLILDVGKDISNPQIKKPGNRNPHEGSYITSVSWNKQVANILASASENGLIALWDIKANKSIFQFKDSPSSTNSSGSRNVVICWSKTISTQLAVTLDDEKRNQLQIWDLRNQKGPVAVFDRGHTKGINTMQWCQTQPDLILTGGRDNRVVCWNYTQEQGPISTYSLNSEIYDIKWSKKLKSIYAASLQDRLQIYSLDNANLFSYVPKSYKVPIVSTFFGNESIMKYSQAEGQKLIENKILQLIPASQNNSLTNLLKDLEGALDENSLQQKSKESQFWNLINIKNSNSGDDAILDYLGFNKEKIIKQVEKYTGKKRENSQNVKTEIQPKHKNKAYTPVVGQQAASFFASIGQTQMKTSKISNQQQEQSQSIKYDMVPRNPNWNIGKQRLIKHNILIGNYQGAIDAAIKCGRTAEALIIAYSVDQNTFNSTLKTFFTQTTDNFITDVLKNMTYRDNQQLVKKYDVHAWKQCVSIIYSISTSQKRKHLLNLLASRIRQQSLKKTNKKGDEEFQIVSQDNPAIQCYILSQNFDQIANLYFQNLKNFQSGSLARKQTVLQYAKRLILIFNSLTIQIIPNKNFQKIIRQAAFIATQQNFKMVAYIIFSNYLYESSMREVDMIIHATKNLQQYRNSIVFKQISIPVMQFKENKPQSSHQPQGQKGKRGLQTNELNQNINSTASQQPNSGPVRVGQGVNQNPNIPTKDKNLAPRVPIFTNKRDQQKQVNIPVVNIPASNLNKNPPPPPIRNKPPQVLPSQSGHVNQPNYSNYEQQQSHNNDAFNKNKLKKLPPPPGSGIKTPQTQQNNTKTGYHPPPPSNQFSHQQQSYINTNHYQQQQHTDHNAISEHQSEKKNVPPPAIKNKKIPPPPTSSGLNQSLDYGRQKEQQSSFYSTQQPQSSQTTSNKIMVPPPPSNKTYNQNIPPSGTKNIVKPYIQQQQQYNNEQLEDQDQTQNVYNQGQKFTQQTHTTTQSKVKPPPVYGQRQAALRNQNQQQNSFYNANQTKNTQISFNQPSNQNNLYNNKPPDFSNSSKKNLPPPPPAKKQISHHQQYQQNSNSRTRVDSLQNPNSSINYSNINSGNKSIPPSIKMSAKIPPPPLPGKVQSSHINQFNPNQQVKLNQQSQQSYQQPQQEQKHYHENLIIKKPPPVMSAKKTPPPPPKR